MVENRLCRVTVVPWDLAALLLVTQEPWWSYVIAVPAGGSEYIPYKIWNLESKYYIGGVEADDKGLHQTVHVNSSTTLDLPVVAALCRVVISTLARAQREESASPRKPNVSTLASSVKSHFRCHITIIIGQGVISPSS